MKKTFTILTLITLPFLTGCGSYKIGETRRSINTVMDALAAYHVKYQTYPESLQELKFSDAGVAASISELNGHVLMYKRADPFNYDLMFDDGKNYWLFRNGRILGLKRRPY